MMPTKPLPADTPRPVPVAGSLKRGIFYTFLSQAPTLLLYFVASTLMTRALGDEGRGAYALLQNQTVLLAMLLGLNVGFGLTYYTAKEQGDPRLMVRIAASAFLLSVLATPALLVLIYWNEGLREVFLPKQAMHWAYLAYILLAVVLSQSSALVSSILLGRKQFKTLNRMSIINAALSAVGFSTLYLLRDHVAPDRILIMVLAVSLGCMMVQTGLWFWTYVRQVGILPVPIWDWSILRPFLAFVLVGYLSNLINLVNYRFDVWVVGNSVGTAQLGLYAVAVGVGQLLFFIPEPFSRVVQPFLYGQVENEMLARFKFISRLNFTTVLALALLAGLAAPWVVPLLFGPTFNGSVIALQWLLPGIVSMSFYKLTAPLVVQGGLIRFNLYAISIAALITVVLDFWLIPQWGIVGASVASSIAYFSLLVLPCWVIRTKMKISVRDMFLLRPSDISNLRVLMGDRLSAYRAK
jgi:O-antigen/teichoic acid export membrane protein